MTRIYLDHAATTTTRAEAIAAMVPLLGGGYNPNSLHAEGRAARAAIDDARATIARVLGAHPREIVFTGGGSESDTLAVVGGARAASARGRHVVTSAIEHPAVLGAVARLEREGWTVTRLPVDAQGLIDPAAFEAALTPQTALASIMLANNEIGVIEPIAQLARIARAHSVVFHTDAVQAPGWLPLDVGELGVDLLTLSAHKFEGPKGVGVLYVRRGVAVEPIVDGGGQEHGLRPGTEDVAGIAGTAVALQLADAERAADALRVAALRDRLADAIAAQIPDVVLNATAAPRLPGLLSVAFGGAPSDALLMRLDLAGIAASAGSACAAGSLEPSHVAAALGLGERYRGSVIRFSLGKGTTEAEIDQVIRRLPALVADVRSPVAV
jgi:cysteine desulfurase